MAMASCVLTCQECKAVAFMRACLSRAPSGDPSPLSFSHLSMHPRFGEGQECRSALGTIHITWDRFANPTDAIDDDFSTLAWYEQRRHVVLAGGGVLGLIVDEEGLAELAPGQRHIDPWAMDGFRPGGTGVTGMGKAGG